MIGRRTSQLSKKKKEKEKNQTVEYGKGFAGAHYLALLLTVQIINVKKMYEV